MKPAGPAVDQHVIGKVLGAVLIACLVTLGDAPASAGWTVVGSGAARADSSALAPVTALSVTQSCTPTSPTTISVVGSSSALASSGVATVARPAGVAAGDVLIGVFAQRLDGISIAPPAGWTLLAADDAGGGNLFHQAVYAKVATAAEPATYTWTSSGTAKAVGVVVAYRGVDPASAVNAVSSSPNGNSATIGAAGVTTTVADARLVGVFGIRLSTTITSDPAMSQVIETRTTGAASSSNVTVEVAEESQAAAGATGARAASAAGAMYSVGHLLALKPKSDPVADLSWTASASSWAAGYEWRQDAAGWTTVPGAGATSAASAALLPGTTYDYEVRTLLGSWRSASETVQLTTTAC